MAAAITGPAGTHLTRVVCEKPNRGVRSRCALFRYTRQGRFEFCYKRQLSERALGLCQHGSCGVNDYRSPVVSQFEN